MVFRILLAMVVLAPLPIGSVYAWTWLLMAIIVGGLLAVWSVRVLTDRQELTVGPGSIWPLALLFVVVIGWGAFQSVTFAPSSWPHPIWSRAAAALGRELPASISIDADQTRSQLVRLCSYAGIFWLALQHAGRSESKLALRALVAAGCLYSAYGLIVHWFGSATILWFPHPAGAADVTSTFVNRNSFATYAGLTLLCTVGLLTKAIDETFSEVDSSRERIRKAIEFATIHGWPMLLAAATILMALLQSHSRAGFISVIGGLGAFLIVHGRSRPIKHRRIVAAVCLTGMIGLYALAGGTLDQRLAEAVLDPGDRPAIYAVTLSAIRERPLLGTGFGTFADIFAVFRDVEIAGRVTKAHSSYLENVLELGLPAAIALFGIFVGFLVITYRGARRHQRTGIFPAIGFGATVLVALHATVDFSLQIPAVTVTYCLLVGLACGRALKRSDVQQPSSRRRREP